MASSCEQHCKMPPVWALGGGGLAASCPGAGWAPHSWALCLQHILGSWDSSSSTSSSISLGLSEPGGILILWHFVASVINPLPTPGTGSQGCWTCTPILGQSARRGWEAVPGSVSSWFIEQSLVARCIYSHAAFCHEPVHKTGSSHISTLLDINDYWLLHAHFCTKLNCSSGRRSRRTAVWSSASLCSLCSLLPINAAHIDAGLIRHTARSKHSRNL